MVHVRCFKANEEF